MGGRVSTLRSSPSIIQDNYGISTHVSIRPHNHLAKFGCLLIITTRISVEPQATPSDRFPYGCIPFTTRLGQLQWSLGKTLGSGLRVYATALLYVFMYSYPELVYLNCSKQFWYFLLHGMICLYLMVYIFFFNLRATSAVPCCFFSQYILMQHPALTFWCGRVFTLHRRIVFVIVKQAVAHPNV